MVQRSALCMCGMLIGQQGCNVNIPASSMQASMHLTGSNSPCCRQNLQGPYMYTQRAG